MMKDKMKSKGFSIAPAELEAGEIPKAFVVLHGGTNSSVTVEELIAFVNGKLTGYKKLHEVEFVESLPKLLGAPILAVPHFSREKFLHEGNQFLGVRQKP